MKARSTRGLVVAITGGAQGIGYETARQLIDGGATVALLDRDAELVASAATRLGASAQPWVVDVTDRQALITVLDEVVAHTGRLDVVIANAGIAGPVAPVVEVDQDAMDRVIAVDLNGVMNTAHAALPHLTASRGYLLLISSLAAAIPTPTIAAYGAAKAGVEAFGRALRIEMAPTGVDVGIAYFGLIGTKLAEQDLLGSGRFSSMTALSSLLTPAPVEDAGSAIRRGIERRSRTVAAPWWVPLGLHGRSAVALADRLLGHVDSLTASLPGAAGSTSRPTPTDTTTTTGR